MSFGLIALLLAVGAAGWLLWRAGRSGAPANETRNVTLMKGVAFLVLVAALFAAKLWPLALMTLLAAAAVTAIEVWRGRAIKIDEAMRAPAPTRTAMKPDEATAVLGVPVGADAETIRAAHRKLISQLHPDKGGTDYLASKINDARDVLLSGVTDAGAVPPPDGAP